DPEAARKGAWSRIGAGFGGTGGREAGRGGRVLADRGDVQPAAGRAGQPRATDVQRPTRPAIVMGARAGTGPVAAAPDTSLAARRIPGDLPPRRGVRHPLTRLRTGCGQL